VSSPERPDEFPSSPLAAVFRELEPTFAFRGQERVAGASARNSAATRPPRRVYFFSAGALDGDFAIDVVGTIMWAYGVPFHITHGPPLVHSVGYASS
jgi:hypothetical protein